MRRTLLIVLILLLASLPGPTLAKSPAPSGPTTMEIGPGVTAEVLAVTMGQGEPVMLRVRFKPGSSWDAPADTNVALVSIESGTLAGTVDHDITVYLPGSAAGQLITAGTATTLPQGTYFLGPPNAAGHLANDGAQEASMLLAFLPVASPAPQTEPGASPSPQG